MNSVKLCPQIKPHRRTLNTTVKYEITCLEPSIIYSFSYSNYPELQSLEQASFSIILHLMNIVTKIKEDSLIVSSLVYKLKKFNKSLYQKLVNDEIFSFFLLFANIFLNV